MMGARYALPARAPGESPSEAPTPHVFADNYHAPESKRCFLNDETTTLRKWLKSRRTKSAFLDPSRQEKLKNSRRPRNWKCINRQAA